jgi:hypothetical protein
MNKVGRKRKTDDQLKVELAKIRRLVSVGHTDNEIMDKLKIPRSTFYYYKKKLNEESSQEFMKKEVEDLAFDVDVLRDRLTIMFKVSQDKLNDKNTKAKDIPNLLEAGQELAINLFRLESEGLKALDNRRLQTIQNKHLNDNQSNNSIPGI